VRSILRAVYGYHTGVKGWHDIAYNFLVDAYGGIWEGRQGSLTSPVKGDATGGSQGYAQLCCFIGNHQSLPPTGAAVSAMTELLRWLAARYSIDLRPTATAKFVSRGSSLHPAGQQVITATLAGHRDMSATTCPGDAAYRLVQDGTLRPPAPSTPASDLVFIKTKNTGSDRVEIHAATAESGYQGGTHNATYLGVGDADNGWFQMVGGDLFFIKTRNTGGGRVEVHSAVASSGYQAGQHNATYLGVGEADNGSFQVARG